MSNYRLDRNQQTPGYASPSFKSFMKKNFQTSAVSRVAQWKRAGPITQGSEDQNLALLAVLFLLIFLAVTSLKKYSKSFEVQRRSLVR